MDANRLVGAKLRELRRAAGLSQDELAERFGSVPALPPAWRHTQTVSQAETGARNFTATDLIGLAAYFGVPIAFLFDPDELVEGVEIAVSAARLRASDFRRFLFGQMPRSSRHDVMAGLDENVPSAVLRQLAGDEDERPSRGLADHKKWSVGEAYRLFRESRLADRTRRAVGPTVTPTTPAGPVAQSLNIPPWGASVLVTIPEGERFTARDEVEADLVKMLVDHGFARRVRPRKEGA